jgi:hypothetical protein
VHEHAQVLARHPDLGRGFVAIGVLEDHELERPSLLRREVMPRALDRDERFARLETLVGARLVGGLGEQARDALVAATVVDHLPTQDAEEVAREGAGARVVASHGRGPGGLHGVLRVDRTQAAARVGEQLGVPSTDGLSIDPDDGRGVVGGVERNGGEG